jgi:N-ethylmaleimide reductase
MTTLFDPIQVGEISLSNRIVMAPLTRNRALEGDVPGPLTVEYYRQRATAGLIISEASQISPMGQGYLHTPGIYSEAQIEAWKQVTQAVHAEGGKIVIQLWHVGRISHSSLLPNGVAPVSSTARRAEAQTYTAKGFVDVSEPRPLSDAEIPALIDDYRQAALNAMEAGFDGVEIHAANAYLIDQFLRDSVNDRTGPYGGEIAHRARLLLEVTRAVVDAIGSGRTGIRLSPMTTFSGTPRDSNPEALFAYVADHLSPLGLAYVHVIEGETGGSRQPEDATPFDYGALHQRFQGPWMINNGFSRAEAIEAVSKSEADLVAFGRSFISNPDLVARLKLDAPLNEVRFDKLYGGGAEGYIDYPTLG